MPVLILREGGPTLTGSHHTAITARHILVPLVGSALAEAVLAPAASLSAALAASSRNVLHLMRIVHPDEMKKDARALEPAQRYLSTVVVSHALSPQTTCSVAVHADVATALIAMAGENAGESRCDLIALAMHGRSGVQRLILGSITEHVLSSAMVPLLIIRPLVQHAHEPDPRSPLP